jgi:hypothetical protein
MYCNHTSIFLLLIFTSSCISDDEIKFVDSCSSIYFLIDNENVKIINKNELEIYTNKLLMKNTSQIKFKDEEIFFGIFNENGINVKGEIDFKNNIVLYNEYYMSFFNVDIAKEIFSISDSTILFKIKIKSLKELGDLTKKIYNFYGFISESSKYNNNQKTYDIIIQNKIYNNNKLEIDNLINNFNRTNK